MRSRQSQADVLLMRVAWGLDHVNSPELSQMPDGEGFGCASSFEKMSDRPPGADWMGCMGS